MADTVMICTHENAHYAVDGRHVCFACFFAHKDKERAAKVVGNALGVKL